MVAEILTALPKWFGAEVVHPLARILGIIIGAIIIRWILARAVRRLVERSAKMPISDRFSAVATDRLRQRTKTVGSVLRSIITGFVFVMAFLLILAEFDINLGPLLASAGVAGVALGFGAQNLVRDFLSGTFIVLEDQYGVGDIVNLGEVIGTVEAVTLRTTQVRDINGITWYVRNGEILRVANLSQGWATAIVDLPLTPTTDVTAVRVALNPTLASGAELGHWAEALLSTPVIIGLETVPAGQLVLRITARTSPERKSEVQRGLLERCLGAVAAAGITLPTPGPTA